MRVFILRVCAEHDNTKKKKINEPNTNTLRGGVGHNILLKRTTSRIQLRPVIKYYSGIRNYNKITVKR